MKKIKTRDIKFRAKRADNGEWVEGFYFLTGFAQEGKPLLEPCIQVIKGGHYHNSYKVIPETIGQYTGLTDKNGKQIFEGDRVVYTLNHDSTQKEIESVVEWYKHAWRLNRLWLLTEICSIEVIGNIHDNPELVN